MSEIMICPNCGKKHKKTPRNAECLRLYSGYDLQALKAAKPETESTLMSVDPKFARNWEAYFAMLGIPTD